MRKLLVLFFLFVVSNVFAQNDTLKKHELYFGVNLTRLIVKDYELQLFYRINNKTILGISGGYDLNKGEELFTDTKASKDTAGWHAQYSGTSEGETHEASRYFFGTGPAFRISCDFLFSKKHRTSFVTPELMLKIRNYDNYIYQQYESVFLESASQKIYGMSIYFGGYTNIQDFFLLKFFGGFGFRYLQSDVVRPGSYDYSYTYWHPEERFNYHLAFPTVHLGVSLIINPAGTGKPTVEK